VKKPFKLLKDKTFLIFVLIPTLTVSIYYAKFASDIYLSESQLIIRTPEKQTSSLLGDFLQGTGFIRSQDDAYTVQKYILSRDAMRELDKKLIVKEKFSSTSIDPLSRFAGVLPDNSYESFYRYYQKMVEVELDASSGIITLRSRAFKANDAQDINQNLLAFSEELVNKLNERARQDMIHFAQKEVDNAEVKAKTASLALARYQNTVGVIDPQQQSAIPLQQIAKLQDELISTRTQILQIETLSAENPQLPVLHKKAEMLEKEIDKESSHLTGSPDKSLVSKAVQFNRLSLDKEFADRQLASTLASLEQARAEAQRQQLYVERIAQPSLPDVAQEPYRMRIVATIFILGTIIWGIISLLISGIKEHQD
jgi:capsular polysaccharide transport system permease protein